MNSHLVINVIMTMVQKNIQSVWGKMEKISLHQMIIPEVKTFETIQILEIG